MNPGVSEEVGKTARSFFEVTKDNPVVILLSVANLMMVTFMYFALRTAGEFRTELIKQSFEYQKQAADLLSKCSIVAPPSQPPK